MPTVCLVRPSGYPHAEALAELEETVRYGLVRSGLWEGWSWLFPLKGGPRRIVLGAHLISVHALVGRGDIIYNSEHPSSPWWSSAYRKLLETHEVWDYRPDGVGKYVPIGYVPELTRIDKADPQDIDVLFYGSMNERRAKVVHDLEAAGLNVVTVFGCYGAERDALIARSKVVLNMHYYTPGAFEAVRVSYLWANKKCVVSETSDGLDAAERMSTWPYEALVNACCRMVSDAVLRREYEIYNYRRITEKPEANILDEALK
jgi:hypothetical protein